MWRRAAPIATGGAMVGAAWLVAANDPSAPGSHFPACQFRAITGLWCPGCGLTRGFHQLLTGHPISALQHNIFVPIVLAIVAFTWWSWLRTSFGRPALPWPRWLRITMAGVVPTALVVYGILRNIPAAPFSALAP